MTQRSRQKSSGFLNFWLGWLSRLNKIRGQIALLTLLCSRVHQSLFVASVRVPLQWSLLESFCLWNPYCTNLTSCA